MKRRLFSFVLLAVVFQGTLQAQVGNLMHNLSVGVSGGANVSFVDFSPTVNQTFQPGINGGIVLRYTSERYFSMFCAAQLEVNYTQRGWNELIDDGSLNTYSCTTTYVEMPFMAHLSWGKLERGAQFFFNAGPDIAWNIGRSECMGFTDEHPWSPDTRPNRVNYQYGKAIENPFEYGIAASIGCELKTVLGNFTIEGRYFYGLSDMYLNSKADPFGRSANNTITVKIAYLIDIRK